MFPEDAAEEPVVEETAGGDTASEPQPSAGNPAWEAVRAELDPISFSKIEKHLKGFDDEATRRITKTNEDFKWAKEYSTQGVTPDQISKSLSLAKAIDENPEDIYARLGQFLEENGRMPASKKELEENTEDPDEAPEDPRLAQFEATQNQMLEFLQHQQRVEQDAQMDQSIGNEIEQLKTKHPEFAKEDIREVLQRAAMMTQQTGRDVSLEDAANEYNTSVRNRLLSTPRSGDSAPRLVPTNGSVPPANAQRTLGGLSRAETQDLIAGLLSADK